MFKSEEDLEIMMPNRGDDRFPGIEFNITDFLKSSSGEVPEVGMDPEYEQFLADVWVGIVLTLMVLSCVCFMCSCLIYHKFQQWKSRVIEARNAANLESGLPESDLPSYTIASGLPTYEQALEQLKRVKEPSGSGTEAKSWVPHTPPTPALNSATGESSLVNLFHLYKNAGSTTSSVKTT